MKSVGNPLLVCVLLAGMLSACAPSYVKRILKKDLNLQGRLVEHVPPDNLAHFEGIADWLEQESVVNVVLVPGMRHKHWHNYNNLIHQITEPLGLEFDDIDCTTTESGFEGDLLGKGELIVLKFKRTGTLAEGTKQVNFYFANWTPITKKAKDALIDYEVLLNNQDHPYPAEHVQRTYFADKIKNRYFIDVFADLALYRQPDYQYAIQKVVLKAFDQMNEAGTADKPMVFVTGSMGSEVAIDALYRMLKFRPYHNQLFRAIQQVVKAHESSEAGDLQADLLIQRDLLLANIPAQEDIGKAYLKQEFDHIIQELVNQQAHRLNQPQTIQCLKDWCKAYEKLDHVGKAFKPNLKQIFMLNNQLVFSSLLDYKVENLQAGIDLEDTVMKKLGRLEDPNLIGNSELKVISFYDPNDVFGFQIPQQSPIVSRGGGMELISIPINHATQWTIDAQRFKRDYLFRLPIGDLKNQLSFEISDDQAFNVSLNLEEPSEAAKINESVFSYIRCGWDGQLCGKTITEKPEREIHPHKKVATDKPKTLDGVTWKDNPSLLNQKKVFTPRMAWLVLKVSRLFRPVELPHTKPPQVDLPGIEKCFRQHDTVYVLTVHGMGDKQVDHFDGMAGQIADRLGFIPDLSDKSVTPQVTTENLHFGIREQVYRNSKGQHLIFMIVHWSPITKPIKEALSNLDRRAASDPFFGKYEKSFIHRTLKEHLIINGFVDVNLSLGKGGFLEQMSQAVGRAMTMILEDDTCSNSNIILISGSLGSKVLYDHITHSLRHEADSIRLTTQRIMSRTNRWYMLTNQIPMIGLKELNASNRTQPFDRQVWHAFEQLYDDGILSRKSLEIVAFHDPNDIMTFMLPDISPAHQSGIHFYNLPMRTGDGFEVDLLRSYKFLRKVDRKVFKTLLDENRADRRAFSRRGIEAVAHEEAFLATIQKRLEEKASNHTKEASLIKARKLEIAEQRRIQQKMKNTPLIIPALMGAIEFEDPYQTRVRDVSQSFMLRFDKAHEGVKTNDRILDVIVFGTPTHRQALHH